MTFHIESLSEFDNPDLRAENPEIFGVLKDGIKPRDLEQMADKLNIIKPNIAMSEADLQKEVVKYLQGHGYKVLVTGKARLKRNGKDTYVTPYQADGKGFCDIFAANPEAKYKTIALELKSTDGKTSPEQVAWLLTLSRCGILTGVVTPATWETMKEKVSEAD